MSNEQKPNAETDVTPEAARELSDEQLDAISGGQGAERNQSALRKGSAVAGPIIGTVDPKLQSPPEPD